MSVTTPSPTEGLVKLGPHFLLQITTRPIAKSLTYFLLKNYYPIGMALQISFLFFLLFFSMQTHASCEDKLSSFGKYRLHQFKMRADCALRVTRLDASKPHRNFQIFNNGLFEVYTTIPNKSGRNDLGSRSYFILPAPEAPNFEIIDGFAAKLKSSSKHTWLLDEAGNIKGDEACTVTQSPITNWEQEAKPKSGFYLKSCTSALVIDFGFKRGEPPNLINRNGFATIRDPYGNSCQVKNTDLMNYSSGKSGDYTWRYKSNIDLAKFISNQPKCIDIDTSPLYPKHSNNPKKSSGQK